ncbi:MAG TPA: MerR family transcriptional regulator, partial [Acidimicrobiales bacterium]|nr:MerR family transcriptional regulator [Acidimicrobiales bacterium]
MVDQHLSIGEVLTLLQGEFPDVTISKIRFLESQGLIDPERTPSGYRKFYGPDIERLRWILTQQREHFLPLKVIKDRLAETPDLRAPAPAGNGSPAVPPRPPTLHPRPSHPPAASAAPPAPAEPGLDGVADALANSGGALHRKDERVLRVLRVDVADEAVADGE